MRGQVAFEALGALSDGLILEAAEKLGFAGRVAPAVTAPRGRERTALSRFFGSGWGVAVICTVVSLSVLSGVIRAGQRPSVQPPVGTDEPPSESVSETQADGIISKEEAMEIASAYWDIQSGETSPDRGYTYRIQCEKTQVTPRGETVYVVLWRWFVDGHHWSTVDEIWVDCVTGEVIIPYDEPSEETETHVHAFGEWETVTEPTCAAKGKRERVCACGEAESESIAALPHTKVEEPAVPPTVTEPGYTAGFYCEVCGKILSPRSEIPATGHTDLAYEVHDDGKTCTITGIGTCTAADIYVPSSIDGYKVTRIGMIAFLQNTAITGMHIPNTVTEIGEGAFSGCTGLTEITLPGSVTFLDYGVFMSCTGLKTAVIQCRITELPHMTFEGCTALTSVTLPSSLEQIRPSAFKDCVSLKRITLPASLWNLGMGAFQGCTALAEIKLPSRLSYLEDGAFEGCAALTEMTLPDSLIRIGSNAFSGCSGITALTIPSGIKQAEPTAFERMEGLTDIYFGGSTAEWNAVGYKVDEGVRVHCTDPSLEYALSEDGTYYIVKGVGTYDSPSVVIPDTHKGLPVKEIGASAFSSQDFVTELHMGRNVERIGDWGFYQSSALEGVWIHDIEQWLRIDFAGSHKNPLAHAGRLYVNGELLTHLEVPDTVTEISAFAFAGCTSLRSVTLGARVTRIGASAFRECEGLISFTYHTAVQEIGDYAFYNCKLLEEVVLPDAVKAIGKYAFQQCYQLHTLQTGNGVESIGEGALLNCTSLTEISLPASLTYIGKYAFRGCTALTSASFEVTKEWYAKQNATDDHITPFGEAALASPGTAAHFLTKGKEDHFWERKV